MEIIFTNHAKKRMIERGITNKEIKEALNFPDHMVKRADGEIEVFKLIKKKTLKVVYIEKGKFIKVITLYYL